MEKGIVEGTAVELADASTIETTTGHKVINQTGLPDEVIQAEVAALTDWIKRIDAPVQARGPKGRFDRDLYSPPTTVVEEMTTSYIAAQRDDVVGGWLDQVEALAIAGSHFDPGADEEQRNLWGQYYKSLDLDIFTRQCFRDLGIVSQLYAFTYYGDASFEMPRRSRGPRRRAQNLTLPTGVTLLDPTKVVPFGNFLFGRERLAYLLDEEELEPLRAEAMEDGSIASQMFRSNEPLAAAQLNNRDTEFLDIFTNGGHTAMMELNPDRVMRHTLTRTPHERLAAVRMVRIFKLLDLKHQLQAADRASLLGNINAIVLLKKGDKDQPATNRELQALQASALKGSRSPVLIGDHRLSVEMITPDTDHTLDNDRYAMIDQRITASLYQVMVSGGAQIGNRGDDSVKLAKLIGRALSARRDSLARFLERLLVDPAVEANSILEPAVMEFRPKRIALEFDPTLAQMITELRMAGEISRETTLEHLDFNQAEEAERLRIEAEIYDDVFHTRHPSGAEMNGNSAQDRNAQRIAGRTQGGIRNGGGTNAAPGSDSASHHDEDEDEDATREELEDLIDDEEIEDEEEPTS